jgi:hypothetical protein
MESVVTFSNYFQWALLVTLLTMRGSSDMRRKTNLMWLSLQVLVIIAVYGHSISIR